MKKRIKKISLVLLSVLSFQVVSLSSNVFAQEAPQVVAPAQPATPEAAASSAQTATGTAPAAAPAQGGLLGMAMPFVIMLTVMYFLMIRPQQKRMKEHQNLLSAIKAGDEVITSAGIIGSIASIQDKVVTLELSKNVQIRVLKAQIAQVVKNGQIEDLPRQPGA